MKLSTILFATSLVASCAFLGCELSNSPNDTVRNVSVDFSGFYSHDGAPLSSQQTGAKVTSLDFRQTGDRIEAIDNNGIIFKGTLGEVSDASGTASSLFQLNGRTTANGDVTISGTISGTGNSGTMSGTWIEPTLFGNFFAVGTISTVQTNSDNGGGGTNTNNSVALSPSSASLTSSNNTQVFSASGGGGSFSWSISNGGIGNISSTTGQQITYTRTGPGTQTLTVRDSNNTSDSDQATISQL